MKESHESVIDRFKSCIYGQAICDALGLATAFGIDEDIAWKYPIVLRRYSQIIRDIHRSGWKIGDIDSAANGGLMRTSSVGFFPKMVTEISEDICRLTHSECNQARLNC